MSKPAIVTAKACPLLTSNPNNLVEWEEKIHLLAATEHGNSSVRFMHTNNSPLYVRMPEYMHEDNDADEVDNEDYDAVEYTKEETQEWERDHPVPRRRDNEVAFSRYKSKSDRWTKKRQDWLDAQEKIFPLITLYVSEGSLRLISQLHKKEWETARNKNDCLTQMRLIRETHTMRSVKASRAEHSLAERELLDYTQGPRQSLSSYTHEFETLFEKCTRIGVNVDTGKVIYAYLTHVTDIDIADEVGRVVGDEGKLDGEYPQTLEEAKSTVTALKAKKEELILARGGGRKKIVAPQDAPAVHYAAKAGGGGKQQASSDPSQRNSRGEIHITAAELAECTCLYCDKKGHIAQHCFKLVRDKKNKNAAPAAAAPPSAPPSQPEKDKKEGKKKRKHQSMKEVNLAHVEYGMLTTLPLMKVSDTRALLAKVEGVSREFTILDTGANINVVNDTSRLTNVQKIAAVKVKGVSKKPITATLGGTFGEHGFAYFIPSSPYNIVAFSVAKTLHTVLYETNEDKFVCLDKHNGKVLHSFVCETSTGLCACRYCLHA